MYCGGDRIFVDDAYKADIIAELKAGNNIHFYIEKADRTTTQYLFKVDATGFADVYETAIAE